MPEHNTIHAVGNTEPGPPSSDSPPFLSTSFRILYAGLTLAADTIPITKSPTGAGPLSTYLTPRSEALP